jgi:tetratricopeptide (TPR) repeat protein
MSQYPAAVEQFNKAIAIGHELGDRILEASARNNLGLVYDELGDHRKSLNEYNLALELYRVAQSQSGTNATIERGISDTTGNIGGTPLLGEYARHWLLPTIAAIDERLVEAGITI